MDFAFYEYLLKNNVDTTRIYVNKTQFNFYDLFDTIKNNNILIKELDNVFAFANKLGYDYINESIWFQYLVVKQMEIPPISKKITTKIESHNNSGKSINVNYIENKRSKELYFNDSSDFLFSNKNIDLFHSISKNGTSNYYICIIKKAIFNNTKELLFLFLDCLFSTQKPYCIKKCEYCNKYFVAIKTNTTYCNRTFKIKNSQVPCSQIKSFIQKTYEYKMYRKQEKIFLGILNSSNTHYAMEYTNKYKEYAGTVKDKCFKNRDLAPLKTLIDDYKIEHPFKN